MQRARVSHILRLTQELHSHPSGAVCPSLLVGHHFQSTSPCLQVPLHQFSPQGSSIIPQHERGSSNTPQILGSGSLTWSPKHRSLPGQSQAGHRPCSPRPVWLQHSFQSSPGTAQPLSSAWSGLLVTPVPGLPSQSLSLLFISARTPRPFYLLLVS